MPSQPDTMARAMTETQLLSAVVDLAHLRGWLVHHCRPAQDARGRWKTPVQGDAGFPDLILACDVRRVLAVELKSQKGLLTDQQMNWLAFMARSIEVYVWRPADWRDGTIERALL